jgi:hypothetical protein
MLCKHSLGDFSQFLGTIEGVGAIIWTKMCKITKNFDFFGKKVAIFHENFNLQKKKSSSLGEI